MTFTYRVLLKPSDICFKKKLLPSSFDDGIPLQETLQQLANDEILLEDLPCIDVVWCQKKWVWYTLNNRRLWVFRELEKLGKCQYIATRRVETTDHVSDFLVYGSAELIGESNVVEWDEDGIRITLSNADGKKDTTPGKEIEETKQVKKIAEVRRDWREMTPLTVTVRWNKAEKSDAEDVRMVSPNPDVKPNNEQHDQQEAREIHAEGEESQRERKDSGYSASSSGRTSPRDLSDDETEYETVFSEAGFSEDSESRSSSRRFSRFDRDRPSRSHTPVNKTATRTPLNARSYSLPPRKVAKSSKRSNRKSRRIPRQNVSLPRSALNASLFRRREAYDRSMLLLHHGGMSRLEQLALKTRLMNTCGFCFKNFRAGVSLSQHIEELKHWACTRCGKYFESYTALGQHILALEHCNVY
jgi:hypothetical protein